MKKSAFIFVLSISAALATTASAQTESFDLDAQRGEVQEYNPVPGQKIDHKGIVINPTPQSMSVSYDAPAVSFDKGFKVNDRQKRFADNLDFLTIGNRGALPLDIDFGIDKARRAGVSSDAQGAYALTITPKGVKITGRDEAGAFYGLQTLRQIIESPFAAEKGGLPQTSIIDFPSMKYRGVVEGFYGTPWSHQVRLSLIDFYGRNKMNDYLYGPKDDPYHSSPNWRLPYPDDQAKNIAELVQAARRNRVNFIWAIHPGKDIRWNKQDYDSLVSKFNMMYDLGVRSFAIFFDDIEGEGTNPQRQVELLNNLTNDFVKAKGDVTNLIICPTDYSQLWAKPGPDGPLAVYGRSLNPNVEVFWTGAVVCSDLTPETLEFVDSRIQRPALYWWNYPVTDYCKHILLQGPVYGLDTNLTSAQVAGIESNPMEHGEASKLALYGVADYAWNTPAYNPIDNWERGLAYLVPDAADAYRTFAIHSCDTEDGYRRDESWETTTFPYNNYSPEQFANLRSQLQKVVTAEDSLRAHAPAALLGEMSPWLTQLTALGNRCLATLSLIKTFEHGSNADFWNAYRNNLMSEQQKKDYMAHRVGTMKLQPFYLENMDLLASAFYKRLTGRNAAIYRGAGTYPALRTTRAQLMLDGDSTTFFTSANSQNSGDWIGIDLMAIQPVNEVFIQQGRNSIDDCDYFDHVQLEYSPDGKEWTPLTEPLKETYIIHWTGSPVQARYVRLHRLDSKRTNWASVREFSVNPISLQRLALDLEAADTQAALKAFDAIPASAYDLNGQTIAFNRPQGATSLTILSSQPDQDFTITQLNSKGQVVETSSSALSLTEIQLLPSTTRIQINGNIQIHEIF